METHAVRYESREELERDTQRMRSEGWALWRVTAVPEEALIAQFIRKAAAPARGGSRGTGCEHRSGDD